MNTVSLRVDDDTHDWLQERAEDRGSNVSAVVRELIRKGREYDSLKAERDDLRRQLAAVNSRQEDVGDLVEYVREERSLQRRREARERRRERREELRAGAGILTRAKWALTGMPDVSVEE